MLLLLLQCNHDKQTLIENGLGVFYSFFRLFENVMATSTLPHSQQTTSLGKGIFSDFIQTELSSVQLTYDMAKRS